jgi:hypothetical protein
VDDAVALDNAEPTCSVTLQGGEAGGPEGTSQCTANRRLLRPREHSSGFLLSTGEMRFF